MTEQVESRDKAGRPTVDTGGGDVPRIEDILEQLQEIHPEADLGAVQKAYVFAATAHQGMVRRSGEPYLNHPLAVAKLLCEMRLDAASVIAGLLHDTVEDSSATIEDLTALFGPEVAAIVDGVTKIGKISFASPVEQKAENMRKMILAMLTDLRVILVKLADRLHNMRTLGFMPPHKQLAIAEETLEIFAPLAARLGIHRLQAELEDLCLFYLHPAEYDEIRAGLAASKGERAEYVQEVTGVLAEKIAAFNLSADISGRSKHIYSIWRKMQQQNLNLSQVYDLTAFRIIVANVQQCYGVLGVIHSIFTPIPGRFKDYISLPKANGYQSLHTAVIGPRRIRMEVQIRTREMHQYAESGIAAHWRYKAGGSVSNQENKRIMALRSILSWQRHLENPTVFMNTVRESLAETPDSLYVFTPKGEVRELSAGATPVDFAYNIHTNVGHACAGAKVNGAIVPLRHKLRNGDTVEILTNKSGAPSRDWLTFVVTTKAKARIRQWFSAAERERALAFGRDLLEKELRKAGLPLAVLFKEGRGVKELGYKFPEDVAAAVGFGKISIKQVLDKLAPEPARAPVPPPAGEEKKPGPPPPAPGLDRKSSEAGSAICVGGQDNIFVRFASCCSPLPGEDIVGYISHGRGVIVHAAKCRSLTTLEPERLVEVSWDATDHSRYPVTVEIQAEDKTGTLLEIVNLISGGGVNILEAHLERGSKPIIMVLEVASNDQFHQLLAALKQLKRVQSAKRAPARNERRRTRRERKKRPAQAKAGLAGGKKPN